MPTTLNLTTPGVYIQEIPVIPSSIVSVPTAVPVFVGYTAQAMQGTKPLTGLPYQIESMLDYVTYFGNALPEPAITVLIDTTVTPANVTATVDETQRSKYLMYYAVQQYFDNGGGVCYILSIAPYGPNLISESDYLDKLSNLFCPVLEQYNDITLVVCPDAMGLPTAQSYYSLQSAVLAHCIKLQNRMAVMDLYRTPGNTWQQDVSFLRSGQNGNSVFPGLTVPVEPEDFKFGAVYFPRIKTTQQFNLDYTKINVTYNPSSTAATTMDKLKASNSQLYYQADNYIKNSLEMLMPAAPGMVGIYAAVDDSFGVWKAPANVSMADVVDLEVQVSAFDQGTYLNVDPVAGLSINAIRSFPGRGPAIVWGARTLAGNDNEWRYIPVRRFFFMVEQSIKNAIEPFVFEPNDNNTWTRVSAMITTYLTELWKAGALMGTTTKDAFVVQVGLGVTMTSQDVLEGRMIVVVQLAAVRPAEFIILQFEQMMPVS
ncbi:MAG TPA: phage tail sheath C-terminal domain-containing protein [Puia sp.]|nr:phage tail sheath C-terminal domain-containing protein [Puia sp.]